MYESPTTNFDSPYNGSIIGLPVVFTKIGFIIDSDSFYDSSIIDSGSLYDSSIIDSGSLYDSSIIDPGSFYYMPIPDLSSLLNNSDTDSNSDQESAFYVAPSETPDPQTTLEDLYGHSRQ